MSRKSPNILITGTPGTGKSQLSEVLSQKLNMRWLDVSGVAARFDCLEEYDPIYDTGILNEDKLIDVMEIMVAKGGNIVDYHSVEFFPERWFDAVFVLRAHSIVLYDRLTSRGYSGRKLRDNMDCEVFQTVLEEAMASYKKEIIHELMSNDRKQMVENVHMICEWVRTWKMTREQEL